jgi:DNA-binding YbaB/EbfC family protein
MANPFKGMGGGMPDMAKLMSLQKKLVEDAEKMQETLDEARLDGSSGGGMVKAQADGQGHLLSVTIQREAVDPDDVEMLQDLVVTAVQEALAKAEEMRAAEQKKMMPANLPGMPGLF